MRAIDLVNLQAQDAGLWFVSQTVTEDYLQRALRALHQAVEDQAEIERLLRYVVEHSNVRLILPESFLRDARAALESPK